MSTVRISLRSTFGYGGKYYGPGNSVEVPAGLARALGKVPIDTSEIDGERIDEAPDSQPLPPADDPLAAFPQLRAAGYDSPELVRAATDDDLLSVKGIGPATLREIRAAFP